jgi:vacuolar iron transporter family protein
MSPTIRRPAPKAAPQGQTAPEHKPTRSPRTGSTTRATRAPSGPAIAEPAARPAAEPGALPAAEVATPTTPQAGNSFRARIINFRQPPASPHETRGSSVVRPVVFGATDGLVCNLSLIMGVAGAAKEDPHSIVVAGIAGLLAGGFSMAVGEYISVRSQRELLEYQIELQRHQLNHTPEQERAILMTIYEAKGLSRPEADLIVDRIMNDPEKAIDTFVREEIGLSAETMGSPVAAGIGSMGAFAVGALVPLVPFILLSGRAAFVVSIAASGLALFAIGMAVSRLTHRQPIMTGARQVLLGGLAAAVTYGVGSILGASVH